MLEKLLEKCFDEESETANNKADNIKTSVLSRVKTNSTIEEDKPMKKHFKIKPLLIAAAITAAGTASLATANAATDGAVAKGISNTFSLIAGDEEYIGAVTAYEYVDGTVSNVEPDALDNAVGYIVTEDGSDPDNIVVTPSSGVDIDNFIKGWKISLQSHTRPEDTVKTVKYLTTMADRTIGGWERWNRPEYGSKRVTLLSKEQAAEFYSEDYKPIEDFEFDFAAARFEIVDDNGSVVDDCVFGTIIIPELFEQ